MPQFVWQLCGKMSSLYRIKYIYFSLVPFLFVIYVVGKLTYQTTLVPLILKGPSKPQIFSTFSSIIPAALVNHTLLCTFDVIICLLFSNRKQITEDSDRKKFHVPDSQQRHLFRGYFFLHQVRFKLKNIVSMVKWNFTQIFILLVVCWWRICISNRLVLHK